MNYRKLLEHSFAVEQTFECPPQSRLGFLSSAIFDFTTYDGEMDVRFARKALEVCGVLSCKKTFEYIRDPDNYEWYLLMCNMPFFDGKLEWGTSIRGAWWGAPPGRQFELRSCGLWNGDTQLSDPIQFGDDDWHRFIEALIEFAAPEMTPNAN